MNPAQNPDLIHNGGDDARNRQTPPMRQAESDARNSIRVKELGIRAGIAGPGALTGRSEAAK
jgi:hypothetical protein